MSPSSDTSDSPYQPPQHSTTTNGGDSAVEERSRGPLIIAGLIVLLLVLHQDNWFWNDGTLVFGFLPIGLFWHAGISIAAALVWFAATKIAWPFDGDTSAVKPPSSHQPQEGES